MDSQNMSQQAFASFIDISPATLSSIFNGRTKPTLNMVEAIKKKIPNISTDWLMFGTGSMYVQPIDAAMEQPSPAREVDKMTDEQLLDFGLDDDTPLPPPTKTVHPMAPKNNSVKATHSESPNIEMKYIDRPRRHVVEIKVYYDDYTYESFVPAKK